MVFAYVIISSSCSYGWVSLYIPLCGTWWEVWSSLYWEIIFTVILYYFWDLLIYLLSNVLFILFSYSYLFIYLFIYSSGIYLFTCRVLPKTKKKMVLNAFLPNTQHYKVQIKGKWSNPGKGIAPSPKPWSNTYWKGSLRVSLDYGRPTTYYR